MLRMWSQRLHRWLALAFSLPLAAVILTGLVLAFEPIVMTVAVRPGTLGAERAEAILAKVDPAGQARGLVLNAVDGTLAVTGVGPGGATVVDLGTEVASEQDGFAATLFRTSRRIHERLNLGLDWVVQLSTAVMLILIGLGLAMGWPRWRRSLSGWHQALAWIGLPLLVASPVTGLLMAYGVTFAPPGPRPAGAAPLAIREAVRVVGREKDLSTLVWLRPRGGQTLARLNEGGRYAVYAVTPDGLRAMPANWPRLLHEGNYAGVASGFVNVLVSLAFCFLLTTGVLIWTGRRGARSRRSLGASGPVGSASPAMAQNRK